MSRGEDIRGRFKPSGPALPRAHYALSKPASPPTASEPGREGHKGPKTPKYKAYVSRLPRPRKRSAAFGGLVLVAVVLLVAYIAFGRQKTPVKSAGIHPAATVQTPQGRTEKPAFTVYYPQHVPAGLSIDKSSISYTKDSFYFNLKQKGQDSFFVSEQAVAADFNFNAFKSKLTSPSDFKINLGEGVIGGLDAGLVTAVKPKADTLIIVNCVGTVCSGYSRAILENLNIVSDVTKL